MTNSVEIVVKGKNDATRVFLEVEHQAASSARKAEDEWSKSASSSSVSVAKFGTQAEKAGKKAEDGLKGGAKRAGKATDDEMKRVAARTNATFDALKFGGLSLGLPAAAAIGVAGVAATLAIVPALFAGMAAKGLASNDQVMKSFGDLGTHVKSEVQGMSDSLAQEAVAVSDKLGASFDRLEPKVRAAMVASGGYVGKFTDDVTAAAENAMPGLLVAVNAAGPVMEGLGSFARQSGAGVSEMLVNMSHGSADAGTGLNILGGSVRNLLAFAGQLTTNLASNHRELTTLDAALSQGEQAFLHLTAAGSGAVGFLHGFGAAGLGAITIISGLVSAASALPPQVTQFGGSFAASAMLLQKFGVDATKSFDGIGGRIKTASKESGLLKATVSELTTAALSPATLATAGLSVVLWGLGEAQQKAAARAQEHKSSVLELTDAIRKDKGVVSDASLETIAHGLTQKNAAANLDVASVSFAKATVAASGNSRAMSEVADKTNEWIQTIAGGAGAKQSDIDLVKSANSLLLQQGGAYSELNPTMQAVGKSQDQINESNKAFSQVLGKLGPQQAQHLVQLLNGTGAVGEQARATREAYDAYQLQEQGLTDLSEAQIKARDATTEHTAAIYNQVNASLGLRGAQMNTKQALDDYNKSLSSNGANSDKTAESLFHLEQAWQAELTAVQTTTTAHSTATTEAGRTAEGLAAMNHRAVELANSFGGRVPESLVETISKMSVTEAKAAGLSVAIDGTGAAVYRLPNGKEIKITADTQGAMDAVNGLIRGIDGKVATIHVQTVGGGSAYIGIGTGGRGSLRAAGGPIGHAATGGARGGLTWVGEQGPELVKLPVGSFVSPAGQSSRHGGGGGGSGGRTEVAVRIDLSGGDRQFMEWLKDRIRKDGGNVQTVLGAN